MSEKRINAKVEQISDEKLEVMSSRFGKPKEEIAGYMVEIGVEVFSKNIKDVGSFRDFKKLIEGEGGE